MRLSIVVVILQLVEDLHDARELRWVVVEFFEKRVARLIVHGVRAFRLPAIFELSCLALSLESEVYRLVGVNDEGDDDVDEDQVSQLDERDKVKDHSRVFLVVVNLLVHVDELLPVVHPH